MARFLTTRAVPVGLLAAIAAAGPLASDEAHAETAARSAWSETFARPSLGWSDPSGHGPELLARVYGVQRDGDRSFLHARHDATTGKPPAMHYGTALPRKGVPLDRVQALRWRWRVTQHPRVGADPWLDLGASVYVVFEKPGLFSGGKGFKFGWLARPGARGTHQRGILQVPLRSDAASPTWRDESVDLCALYRAEYGSCSDAKVIYIGVVTDADGTRSIAEGDYADFDLHVTP